MTPRIGQVIDEYKRGVPGATVYVYNEDGTYATLTSDGTATLAQPILTDEFGNYSYYANSGVYREDTWYGGKLRFREVVPVGLDGLYPPVPRAGQFFAFDALGNPVAASGTGADAGLRTDVAANTGATLIGWISSLTGAVSRTVAAKLRELISVTDFGAAGDGATDDNAAFQAVSFEDRGHSYRVPANKYRISASSIYRGLVKIEGEGWGQNPGTVDGVSYPYPNFYNGSVIYPDAGVTAIEFQPFTSLTDVATVTGNMAAAETQQSAYGSGLRDIAIVSAGNGAVHAGKPLIYSRTKIYVDGVLVAGGGAEGLRIEANSVDISSPFPAYGNANGSVISRSSFINNAGDGLLLGGSDTNAIITFGCTFQNNGGFGLNDQSFLGGVHIGNIWEPNTGGSIKTGANAPVLILGGDIEAGQTDLGGQTMVIGGIAATDAMHPLSSPAFVLNAGQAIRKPISGLNNLGAVSVVAGLGRDPSYTPGGKIAFWFGSLNDSGGLNGDAFKLKYEFQWTGIWSLNYRNALEVIEFPTGQTSFYGSLTNAMAAGFPNGIAMGTVNSAPRLLPAASSIPTTGTYRQGDWVPNSAPAISAGKVLLGWSRLTTGSANVAGTDWTPVYGTTS